MLTELNSFQCGRFYSSFTKNKNKPKTEEKKTIIIIKINRFVRARRTTNKLYATAGDDDDDDRKQFQEFVPIVVVVVVVRRVCHFVTGPKFRTFATAKSGERYIFCLTLCALARVPTHTQPFLVSHQN